MISKKKFIIKCSGYLDSYNNDEYDKGVFITILNNNLDRFFGCREELLYDMNASDKYLGFYVPYQNCIKNLNEFFETIETKLKLSVKTVFFNTDVKNLIIIKMARFWMANPIKRSLMSLFIRCGAIYYTNNFDKAIKQYNLSNQCSKGIYRFLEGNTYFKLKEWARDYYGDRLDWDYNNHFTYDDWLDDWSGIVDLFDNNYDTAKFLVKPKSKMK